MAPRLILSAGEMLSRWRLLQGLEMARTDASVTRTDGIDLDGLMMSRIDAWYVHCLMTMPPSALPLTDIGSSLTMTRTGDGAGMIRLPPDCLRVTEVTMQGWNRPALIVPEGSPEEETQLSPFTRGKTERPVVIASERLLRIYTPPEGASTKPGVLAVMLPPQGEYHVTEPMLASIPCVTDNINGDC